MEIRICSTMPDFRSFEIFAKSKLSDYCQILFTLVDAMKCTVLTCFL